MKILIDLQALQSINKNRGIGRYSFGLAQAIAKNSKDHEIFYLLNNCFSENIDSLIFTLSEIIDRKNIIIFNSLNNISEINEDYSWRNRCASLIYQKKISDISPDIVHVSSFFDGIYDDSVVSLDNSFADYITSVTLYDLIPYIYRKQYFSDKSTLELYLNKINQLTNVDMLLAISESSRNDAIKIPEFSDKEIVNIYGDAERYFKKVEISDINSANLFQSLKIRSKFIMYTGGIDFRKNIEKLIKAYSILEKSVIKDFQLLIICEISQKDRDRLNKYCRASGLKENDVIFTGFISDENMIILYNLCQLFVFPSLHEGFGLPVLEAMRCGAPVIGSNKSSIPEIIDYKESLFDPESVSEISCLMNKALLDKQFREQLILNSENQQGRFSWDKSARKAIETFEYMYSKRCHNILSKNNLKNDKKKLAYISPLPPDKSGIADYSAEVLPEFKKYYDIILVTEMSINIPELNEFETITIEKFKNDYSSFDRVLYHFGNSEFHEHMFELIENYPGTIILHDFFLSGICQFMEAKKPDKQFFKNSLFYSHGYNALSFLKDKGAEKAIWQFPCNKKVLDNAIGVIVHSKHAITLAQKWYGKEILYDWKFAPLPRIIPEKNSKTKSRKILNLKDSEFIVCTFGNLTKTKINNRLLEAWLESDLCRHENSKLIFVGSGGGAAYESELKKTISSSVHKNKITITGFVSLSDYKNYLCAADIAVQLRTTSRGETSISVLDCLSHGIPTILNSHGSFAEIPETVVYQLKDDFTNAELIIALEELYNNKSYRDGLAKSGREYVEEHHSPKNSAEQYAQNIECLYNEHPYFKHKTLIRNVTEIPEKLPGDNDLVEASISISENFPTTTTNQLFVDISELIKKDAKSGIQRVVHGILSELLTRDLIYHVKPVYKKNGRYFYAHDFTLNYLKLNYKLSEDRVIDIQKDDIFLALDLHIEKDIGTENFLEHHKRRGLKVYSVVYDLIPIIQKQFFPHGAFDVFGEWLNKSSRISDGLICISRAVADELLTWLNKNNPNRFTPLEINYFKLGSDFLKKQIPIEKHEVSDTISLLMVGTLEPRKNYSFVIDSLEHLWKENVKVNLTIIGKSGWMNDEIKEKIECHEEYNKRLFWKQNTTDLELEKYYNTSSALIMASECEGFGLPIVEASTYNLPVIARDIPVFHEIADNNVFYFSDRNPKDFSNSMKKWISLFNSDKHPKSINIKRISWKESCNELLSTIIEDNCYKRWEPAEKIYQETQSNTVFSVVGEKEDNMIITTGVEGFLTYGPYKNLKSGKYSIKIFGQILFFENGKSILEITCNKGREVIAKFSLDETLHSGIIIDETFNVYRNSEDVEIRVWVNSFVIAKISKYIVE